MTEQTSFTWLPFFNEMLNKICKEYTPQTLANVFNEVFPKERDQNDDGQEIPFYEVDPLTFIACFNRQETTQHRIEECIRAKEKLNLQHPVPSDFSGIPSFNNMGTWFLTYSHDREKGACQKLWDFAQKAIVKATITEEDIDLILPLPWVGMTKVSAFLFICFPDKYYSTDTRTCRYLKLEKKNTASFFYELQNTAKEAYPNLKPFELSYQAWKDTSAPIKNSLNYWGVGSIWYGNGGDQRERFLANSIWESGYEKDGINKYQQRLDAVNTGDIFVLKTTATDGKDHKHPISYIKNIGIVESRINKYSFNIKWLDLPILPYRLEGKSLWDTIAPIKDQAIINTIKNLMKNIPEIIITPSPRQFPLNQILYGPPGTGKTYHTVIKALEIINNRPFTEQEKTKEKYDKEFLPEFNRLKQQGQIQFLTFHQNYSYEDFMVGIRPNLQDGQISYKLYEGPFKQIADRARKDSNNNYVLIIDEINRGNISKIFGELITLIEEDKRAGNKHALSAPLLYQDKEFSVPNNLYIIGTMNTADKSIALVDIALRRRFVFEEMMPKAELLNPIEEFNLPKWFSQLNQKITDLIDKDHQIGHSYFIGKTTKEELHHVFYQCILPLLNEYFYGESEKLSQVIPGFMENNKLKSKLSIDDFMQALNPKEAPSNEQQNDNEG